MPFDREFRCTFSIDDFALFLSDHLSKTQQEKDGGEEIETCLVSMSSILEWTIHSAGKKQGVISQNPGGVVGLAIFDVKKLGQNLDTAIFRVSDIFEFFKGQGNGQLIAREFQKWAQNYDEYVLMGRISNDGLVRWVVWEELSSPPTTILSSWFQKA
jgi:hypothetical protein